MAKQLNDRTTQCIICKQLRVFDTPADMRRRSKTGKCRKCFEETGYVGKREEASPNWKGDKVGYYGLHHWVKRNVEKPQTCRDCNEPKQLDLANISGEYKRELSDWEWLCRKCHMTKDGRMEKLMNNYNKHPEKRNLVGRRYTLGRRVVK